MLLRTCSFSAVAIGLLLCAFPRPAEAIVLPSYGLVNGPTIPANGVLLLDSAVESVVVTFADGEVPGTLSRVEGWVIWRPLEPPAPGQYTAHSFLYQDVFGAGQTDSFSVVEATSIVPLDLVTLSVLFEVRSRDVIEHACCRADDSLFCPASPSNDVYDTCPAAPQPYCAPIRYQETLRIGVRADAADNEPASSQLLLQLTEYAGHTAASSGMSYKSTWLHVDDDDPVEPEYCATVKIRNLAEDTLHYVEHCEPSPQPVLGEVAPEQVYFPGISRCVLPPEEYTDDWCQSGVQWDCASERNAALCKHYFALCAEILNPSPDDPNPPPNEPAPETPQHDTGTPHESEGSEPSNAFEGSDAGTARGLRGPNTVAVQSGGKKASGCRMSSTLAERGMVLPLVGTLAFLVLWARRRRAQAFGV